MTKVGVLYENARISRRFCRKLISLRPILSDYTRPKRNQSSDKKSTNIKCGSLNVCGVKHRLNYPDFCKLVQNYDIFCVNETKIDKYDTIHLDGYTFISQCRKQKFFRKSGGIGVFVKNHLSPYVSLIESDSDYILWVKLNKKFNQIDQDIIFGAVYLPPSDSRFNTPDELENFEIEITNMCVSQKYVILMGDFNSRTGN